MSSALLARRFRNLSTASLPPDFIFTSPKPSKSPGSPTMATSPPGSPSKLRPLSTFLPLLPVPDGKGDGCASDGDDGSAEDDDEGCPGTPDSEEGDAFSDVSSPTTPSDADSIASDSESALDADTSLSPSTLAAIQRRAFSLLAPTDEAYIHRLSRLLTLRSSHPALCAGEAMALISDPGVPVCWRARAGVYRAESLHALGLEDEARRELGYAGEMVRRAGEERGGVFEETGHGLMEALVTWNIHVGKMNWGMYDDAASEPVELPASAPTGLGISHADVDEPSTERTEQSTVPFPTS